MAAEALGPGELEEFRAQLAEAEAALRAGGLAAGEREELEEMARELREVLELAAEVDLRRQEAQWAQESQEAESHQGGRGEGKGGGAPAGGAEGGGSSRAVGGAVPAAAAGGTRPADAYAPVAAPEGRRVAEAPVMPEPPKRDLRVLPTDSAEVAERKRKQLKAHKSRERFARMDLEQQTKQQGWQAFQKQKQKGRKPGGSGVGGGGGGRRVGLGVRPAAGKKRPY